MTGAKQQDRLVDDGPLAIPDGFSPQDEAVAEAGLHGLSSELHPLNRVRAIFIGYGSAGKTSLIRCLHQEPVLEGLEPMTPGIDIREWCVPGTQIMAHFWDFGGQVIVHATHQLLLRAACVYVLVIEPRSEIAATEQAQYWLEHIKTYGGNAPVLIVGNKVDIVPVYLDLASLHNQYPNIVGFYPVSCLFAHSSEQAHFAAFQQALVTQLQMLPSQQVMFAEAQFGILQNLHQRSAHASFLAQTEFAQLCEQYQIPEQGRFNRSWLLDLLDKLGVIIHFPQLPFLDAYLLNPRWLTWGVYTVMYEGKSHLAVREVIALLGRQTVVDEGGNHLAYPPERTRLLLDVMRAFKLCFSPPDQPDTIIIPGLLSVESPPHQFPHQNALSFEWAFPTFLPRHILSELIVARHSEICQNVVWQNGVWLRHRDFDAQAMVTIDYQTRIISLAVNGAGAREYLMVLRDEVHAILNRITIEWRESIQLPIGALLHGDGTGTVKADEKAPFKQLLACAANGVAEFISESGRVWDVAKVLRNYTPDPVRDSKTHPTNHNIIDSRIVVNQAINQTANHSGVALIDSFGQAVPAARRNLPLGIETFAEIISGNFYYVDKTALILQLIKQGKYYFLSRPRRFGKSLLLDTIKELFECNEALFRGLAVHSLWNWGAPCPVIRISFNDGGLESRPDLEQRIFHLLARNSERLGVTFGATSDPVASFGDLIRRTAVQYQQPVVILVDEYDKPILDQIHAPEIARDMRECLKGLYSVIKGADASIGFALITGVSKFSKVSLFSGLNNLRDITVARDYATLCGYTDADIDTVFAPELMELARDDIRRWYNGYNWLGTPVYNPHGVLSLFLERKFRPFWFESATPTFLIKLLTERETWLPSLGGLMADADMLSTFDVDTIPVPALMFQAGYLTIAKEVEIGGTYYYQMRFPNREVEQSLYGSLLRHWTANQTAEVENKVDLLPVAER